VITKREFHTPLKTYWLKSKKSVWSMWVPNNSFSIFLQEENQFNNLKSIEKHSKSRIFHQQRWVLSKIKYSQKQKINLMVMILTHSSIINQTFYKTLQGRVKNSLSALQKPQNLFTNRIVAMNLRKKRTQEYI
jgi:hypothetical protein